MMEQNDFQGLPLKIPSRLSLTNFEPEIEDFTNRLDPKPEIPKTVPKPNIPYPSRRDNQKNREKASYQKEKIFQMFQDLRFDISFADALFLMPRFAPTIRDLLMNKEKLLELVKIPLNENCSAMLLKKLPEKLGDPVGRWEIVLCNASANGAGVVLSMWNLQDLVDIEIFYEAKKVIDALQNKEVAPAFSGVSDESKFEFQLRLQEFIELGRGADKLPAVKYARKHLAPWTATYMKEFQKIMGALFEPKQWNFLVDQFKQEFCRLYGMTLEPLLNIYLQAGLSALKTPFCYEDDCTKEDPLSQENFRKLANPLPFSKQHHSKLVCYITKELMDTENPPLVLPNGYVYSEKALLEMANNNNGRITSKNRWMWKSSEGVGEVGVDRVKEWAVCGVVGWWFCAVVRYRVAAGGRVLVVVLWDMLAFFTPLVEAKEKFLLSTRVSDTDVEEENSKSKDVMKDNKEAEATKRVWPYPPGFTPRENDVENVEMNNQKDNCDGEFGNVNKIFDEVNFSSGFNTYKKAGGESIVSNHCRESEGSRKECQKKRVYGIIYVMSFDNGMVQYLSGSASKMSKLDRFLMSESLLSECPNLSAITLDRFLSDHRPILLRESTHDYGPIPFWFFHYWLEIEGFENFVNEVWRELNKNTTNKHAIVAPGSVDSEDSRAKMVKDFRPISLIGSLYKIIAKILANRLVVVLGDIVNEVQSAFVADRQILDGPFILNEAYDSVRWDLLDDVLRKFGFGEKWCGWIQECLRSSWGSVLVNGSPTEEFQFFKGLKQGDPLSPFIFILVMESLYISFKRVVDAGMFNGIVLNSVMHLSHMFYADDAVFMGQGELKEY
ncbi:macrophage erythroblast attacher-like protein [Tanacetum coccineum]